MKFGGTSLFDASRIEAVAKIVLASRKSDEQVVVVCSALGGSTDELISLGNLAQAGKSYAEPFEALCLRHLKCAQTLGLSEELVAKPFAEFGELLRGISQVGECSARSMELVMSFGERISSTFMVAVLRHELPATSHLDARLVVRTDDNFGSAHVDFDRTFQLIRLHEALKAPVCVTTGFIGSTETGQTTTLGRGGSDYTASIFGAALHADVIEIWTDVDGVLTADPRKVPGARLIERMTYAEATEMSHFGAKVIHPPTMQPARDAGIPLLIKNTFAPDHLGTWVNATGSENGSPVKGLSSIGEIAFVRVEGSGMIGVAGTASRLFNALSREKVSVILITQGSSENSICFAIDPRHADRVKVLLEQELASELARHQIDAVVVERDRSILAVVGERMRQTPGIGAKVFQALADAHVNVVAIAQGSSERNISIVVAKADVERGLRAIHDFFFVKPVVSICLAGTGNVGGALMGMLPEKIKLMATANSQTNLQEFVHTILQTHGTRVFVDCTASDAPIAFYKPLLEAGVKVVTPNKRAMSGSQAQYDALSPFAHRSFFFETNVGAALPVLSTLRDLMATGDRVQRLEGVLSGTMSYLFNTFDGQQAFSELVAQAKAAGYTEPDPREDLSGKDVGRKLIILAREMGLRLEGDEVQIESLADATDEEIARRFFEAQTRGEKLRYLARIENGHASVSLVGVSATHAAFGLSGTDNLFAFTTDRYHTQPLVIRGPGAGAQVTAAGVLAEILNSTL